MWRIDADEEAARAARLAVPLSLLVLGGIGALVAVGVLFAGTGGGATWPDPGPIRLPAAGSSTALPVAGGLPVGLPVAPPCVQTTWARHYFCRNRLAGQPAALAAPAPCPACGRPVAAARWPAAGSGLPMGAAPGGGPPACNTCRMRY